MIRCLKCKHYSKCLVDWRHKYLIEDGKKTCKYYHMLAAWILGKNPNRQERAEVRISEATMFVLRENIAYMGRLHQSVMGEHEVWLYSAFKRELAKRLEKK